MVAVEKRIAVAHNDALVPALWEAMVGLVEQAARMTEDR